MGPGRRTRVCRSPPAGSSSRQAALFGLVVLSAPVAALAGVPFAHARDSDPFPGVHFLPVDGERSSRVGGSTCGGGLINPGTAAHELWGEVVVAGDAHKTDTAGECCDACARTDGCNVWCGVRRRRDDSVRHDSCVSFETCPVRRNERAARRRRDRSSASATTR